MSTVQRSKSGCWTCRLRRKKCNEGGPPCSNCEARDIFCHGYGPKPAWKDKGDKEREEATRLQLQARRRRRGSSAATANPSAHSHSSSTSSTASAPGYSNAIAELGSPLLTDFDFSLSPSHDYTDFEFHGSLDLVPNTAPAAIFPEDLWPASSSVSANDLLDVDQFPTQAANPKPAAQCLHFFANGAPPQDSSVSEKEIDLVMHFIGEVCPAQMSPHKPSIAQKGWLLFLLMRSPTFYYASLCIAAHSYSLSLSGDSEARKAASEDYQRYRSFALRGFHSMMESSSCSITGENLICGVQIANMEALGRNMQDCQSYLASAAQLLVSQEELLVTSSAVSRTGAQSTAGSQLLAAVPTPAVQSPSQMEFKALAFFRALLIWNDVLSCSAQRKVPVAAGAYRKLLENNDFALSFQDTMGCESWILLAILDATILDVWRLDQEARGTLSIRALVSRAEKIERIVEEGIKRLSRSLQTAPVDPALAPTDHESSLSHIYSYIFAHSVLVDLHTIVSGPKAGVPETSESIDRAISAWKLRPTSIKPHALAWPYCVSASLASGSQRDIFREVTAQVSRADLALGSLHDVKSVVEKCWSGADERGSTREALHDWKDIMQRSKLSILFA
ncbi:Zn(2)-Cys(6) zinc finger domain protein [Pleurostoma richardsiae]|uniref:Zn(2)-Cys(6) zinc finger domain protein n=1 Tax=Pleurostoma richardsiae TaxID=41990 RepID=A0AA38VP05_9PEZI|nr:Zn(2)-Cys(6) zinc finger domain protein [Pleurostoma richardsiae]